MKKICTIVLFVLFLLISFEGIADNKPIGTWTVHPSFAAPAQKVIDTENMVYFLSGNKLFSYDKKNDENYSYTIGNKLSDSDITDIYYNYDRNYLFIAYKSGNIDLLYDDGNVVNMSDITDASINPPLTINSVAFDGDRIYVATVFGLVIFNEPRHEVIQSGIYNFPINAVTILGDNIVIHHDRCFWFADKNGSIVKFDKFKYLYNYSAPKELIPVSDNKMLVRIDDGNYYITMHTIDFETCKQAGWKGYRPASYYYSTFSYTSRGKDGSIYFVDNNKLYAIDGDYTSATFTHLCDLPEELKGCKIGMYDGVNSIWSLNKNGISCHSISTDGGVTVRMERFRPEDFSVKSVYYFYPTLNDKYLYVQNLGSTAYKFEGGIGINVAQNASRINLTTGEIDDMTLYPVDTRLNQNPTTDWYKYATTHTGLASDSKSPDTYFLPTRNEGIFKVNNGNYEGRYDDTNSPVVLADNRWIFYGATMDRGGNLWVMTADRTQKQLPLIVLPAEKCKLNPVDVKPEDWIVPDVSSVGYWGGQDATFLNCKKSNMIFVVTHNGNYNKQLFAYDTRGTFNDFSDDRFYLWESFIDQDGNKLKPALKNCLVEDHDGKVWIGTNEGVIEIANPSNAINPSMTVNHIKVPRNDGTNTADYLLGTDNVMSISVDASNRKWLATYGSGLFLVSPDGHEIIENYTSDNSPLTDNNVNAVYADPNSSTIYIGHRSGLITYSTDASPAEEDYSNVYAFPNPVRPDYTGPIYVRGLMDNSLVKIADVSGNVIFQGRAEGGLFTWDGCTATGKRVKTGVYYVMVSQNASGSSSGAVTKIMVVN